MKKKTIKKLVLNKEDISNLSNEDAFTVRGGNVAPTFVDPAHGGYCTNTCTVTNNVPGCAGTQACITYNAACTTGCTDECPSNRATGCEGGSYGGLCSFVGFCFTAGNHCTYADCTNGCPTTYGDATCTC